MNELGNKISICRQNKNLTQEELARKLGVTAQAVSKWERNLSLPDVTLLISLCKVLEVSSDYMLDLEKQKAGEDDRDAFQEKILSNIRNSLEPLELIFGKDMVSLFMDGTYKVEIVAMRERLSREGILLPLIRIRDELRLEDNEFAVLSYSKVLHLEKANNCTLKDIVKVLESTIRNHYGEVLNPDLTKCLVDNLKIKYPALTEEVVPERISYGLLTQVLKKFLSRGNSAVYLPRIIEYMQYALMQNPDAAVEEITGFVVENLETPADFSIYMAAREKDKRR